MQGAYILTQNHDQFHFYLGGHGYDLFELRTPDLNLQTNVTFFSSLINSE